MNENYFTNALILLVQIVKIAGPDRQMHKNYYTNTLILLARFFFGKIRYQRKKEKQLVLD